MNKILSVIIPLYNSAQWVEKCLDSVLNQDVPMEQMEIICVNDGSPDNSVEIVRGKSEEVKGKNGYSPIVVLDQENQGPSGARNNGMRHATGKYLMFVDPDDYVEPNTFGVLVAQMEQEQLDMLRFNFRMVDESYREIAPEPEDNDFNYTPGLITGSEFLGKRLGVGCNIWRYVYRTELIIRNKIWCYTGDYYDDTPWLPLVLQKVQRMNVVNTVVYDYYQTSNSLVRSHSAKIVKRKLDGKVFLIRLLSEQLSTVSDSSVRDWYLMQLAHSVVAIVSLLGQYAMGERKYYMNVIRNLNVLPLSIGRATDKTMRKIKLINLSMPLAVWMVYISTKIR